MTGWEEEWFWVHFVIFRCGDVGLRTRVDAEGDFTSIDEYWCQVTGWWALCRIDGADRSDVVQECMSMGFIGSEVICGLSVSYKALLLSLAADGPVAGSLAVFACLA